MIPWESCKLWLGYPLQNGVWSDVSNHYNAGVAPGAVWDGDSLEVDGIDDLANCGTHSSTEVTTGLALEALVKTDRLTTYAHIIRKGSYAGIGSDGFYILRHYQEKIQFFVQNGFWTYRQVAAVIEGEWIHVVGTYDAVRLKIYIDGVKEVDDAVSGAIVGQGPSPLVVGSDPNISYPFQGKIALARVYNIALTEEQVRETYEQTYRLI